MPAGKLVKRKSIPVRIMHDNERSFESDEDPMMERIFRRLYPDYLHRWEIYEDVLRASISQETIWLDIGCGRNELVAKYGHTAKTAIGIDLIDETDRAAAPFLQADIRSIPLPPAYADLITMRMVVEHIEKVPEDFSEVERVLAPGGKLIVLTTNALSPVIFIPRLLPYRLKSWIIQRLFLVDSREIFPTHHRFNTKRKMGMGILGMKLVTLKFLEQVPLHRPVLTVIFGCWYAIVEKQSCKYLRSNMLAVFQKKSDPPTDVQ